MEPVRLKAKETTYKRCMLGLKILLLPYTYTEVEQLSHQNVDEPGFSLSEMEEADKQEGKDGMNPVVLDQSLRHQ